MFKQVVDPGNNAGLLHGCSWTRYGQQTICSKKSIFPKTNKQANYELDLILVTVVREASGAPGVVVGYVFRSLEFSGFPSTNSSHVAGDNEEQEHLISPHYRSYALCCFTPLSRRAPFCLIRTSARYPSKVLVGLKLVGWDMSVPTKVSSTVSSVPST